MATNSPALFEDYDLSVLPTTPSEPNPWLDAKGFLRGGSSSRTALLEPLVAASQPTDYLAGDGTYKTIPAGDLFEDYDLSTLPSVPTDPNPWMDANGFVRGGSSNRVSLLQPLVAASQPTDYLAGDGTYQPLPTVTLTQAAIIAALGYTPADDANTVHKTGDETAAGNKTFSDSIVLTAGINKLKLNSTGPGFGSVAGDANSILVTSSSGGAGKLIFGSSNTGGFPMLSRSTGSTLRLQTSDASAFANLQLAGVVGNSTNTTSSCFTAQGFAGQTEALVRLINSANKLTAGLYDTPKLELGDPSATNDSFLRLAYESAAAWKLEAGFTSTGTNRNINIKAYGANQIIVGNSYVNTTQLIITKDNNDYTNVAGAGSHLLLTSPAGTQNVISSVVQGVLSGKWRADINGNQTWVGFNSHYFFIGGDYGVGTCKLKLLTTGVQLSDGDVSTISPSGLAACEVLITTPTKAGLTIKGAAGQSGNLIEYRNSSDVLLMSVSANGSISHTIKDTGADPTAGDIPAGQGQWWKNAADEIRFYSNDGGVIKKSAALA